MMAFTLAVLLLLSAGLKAGKFGNLLQKSNEML